MDHNMDPSQFSELQEDPYGVETGSGLGDRNPQWSHEETRDFLLIRAELDPNFVETKRNKLLWDLVSTRMAEFGYNRTPVQCKCKWKNLVTRYKGCETMMDVELRQATFPFYGDMHIIFSARMERMLWQEVDSGAAAAAVNLAAGMSPAAAAPEHPVVSGLRGVLREYASQQMEMELQWMKVYEEREERRGGMEMEWRQRMEAAESERLTLLRWWKEREEERRVREEARADRRDALVGVLLKKLKGDGI